MRYGLIALVIVVLGVACINSLVGANDAMERCMERHSKDTCISSLR